MIRDIVEVDEALCDGCGQCVPSCAEGALRVVDGKLRLSSDALCDGLGACLGVCPRGALRVVRREAPAFDEHAAHAAAAAHPDPSTPVPRSRPRLSLVCDPPPPLRPVQGSALRNWPVQLHLVSPSAPDLRGADLLLVADCVPLAHPRFHDELLQGRRALIGCPKLDDLSAYAAKLTEIFRRADPRSVRVARMEVPCCGGLAMAARQALSASGCQAPLEVVTVAVNGAVVA